MFRPTPSILLLLVACAPGRESEPEAPWADQIAARIGAGARAFTRDDEGGWVAELGPFRARVDGPSLELGGAELALVGFGRAELLPVAPRWREGACGPETDAAGACVRRIEAQEGPLLHWLLPTAAGLEQGWTLAAPPAGEGPLRLGIAAPVTAVETGRVQLGAGLQVDGLRAWDADGRDLPARFAALPGGFAVEVDDRGARYPVEIDPLYSSAAATVTGNSSGDYLGLSVAGAGDVNGDGYDDIVAGATYLGTAGEVYVFHGNVAGVSSTAATIIPGASSQMLGYAVAAAGDVNLDGYDDIIAGSPGYSSYTGRATLYYGSASGITTTSAVQLSGSSSSYFGASVAGAGDVNGDGYADVVVGAPNYGSGAGRVFTYHGSSTGLGTAVQDYDDGESGAGLGRSVAGAGDVDGDGYDDVIVGAPNYSSNTGYATVYPGSSSGIVTSGGGTTLSGAASSGYFGCSVTGAGDIEGDGYADVAVGSPATCEYTLVTASATGTGSVRVYKGSATGVSTSAAKTLTASSSGTGFGWSVAGLGDIEKDGYADLGVGAPLSGTYAGAAYVYGGGASGLSSTAMNSYTGSGVAVLGASVDGAGDLNADGYEDLVVGSPGAALSYGQASVYLGYGYDKDGDGYYTATDCDDSDASIHPTATELCDAADVDEDCDGAADDADPEGAKGGSEWYTDADGDGYGSGVFGTWCDQPDGASALDTDCDDGDPAASPAGTEVCDAGSGDEDCDGLVDDADSSVSAASKTTWYEDDDGDGYGSSVTTAACDLPAGHSVLGGDCDDTTAAVSPGDTEICDSADTDEDCDGLADDDDSSTTASTKTVTGYTDADGDGYGTTAATKFCDLPSSGYSTLNSDCDDADAAVSPGDSEICDAADTDEDCDGRSDDDDFSTSLASKTTWYPDSDSDGYGGSVGIPRCEQPSGYVAVSGDCNEGDASVSPAAAEICDAADNDEDCDGLSDDEDTSVSESGKTTGYVDADGDGFGGDESVSWCDLPSAYVLDSSDCDDADAAIRPGGSELCDGADADEDCDGLSDDDDPSVSSATKSTFYRDADADGYGVSTFTTSACDAPANYAVVAGDCADGDAAVNPAAEEVCDAADTDEDCNGLEDDADSGVSEASKSTFYVDLDDDGWGGASTSTACDASAGLVASGGDCDDADAAISPGAVERCDEADVDEDCDGLADDLDDEAEGQITGYLDLDGDGYGSVDESAWCDLPGGFAESSDDCDDLDAAIHPAAQEVCDAADVDEDCDGAADDGDASVDEGGFALWYRDGDGDGYGSSSTAGFCDAPEGYVDNDDDCDDAVATVYPTAPESVGDGVDGDCDGGELCYVDADEDGYRVEDTVAGALDCSGAGEAAAADPGGDCDDADPAFHPGASEADCADPTDYNCDGSTGIDDLDGDGWMACLECDDGDAAINPDATEVCDEANLDEDCDGAWDDADPSVDLGSAGSWYVDADGDGHGGEGPSPLCDAAEGYVATGDDCDDADAAVNPAAVEVCDGLTDEDCDGLVDDADDSVDVGSTIAVYTDADGDGWGGEAEVRACAVGEGYAASPEDCDDSLAGVNPGATEVCDEADLDEDCDGLSDDADDSVDPASHGSFHPDADGDGWGDADSSVSACDAGEWLADGSDCDDADPEVFPGGVESPGDLVDGDCDGLEDCYQDADGDGYAGAEPVRTEDLECDDDAHFNASDPAGDCDDADPAFHPAAEESCEELVDYNCDGLVGETDLDGDGWFACDECDDGDAEVHPEAAEVCDGVDNDCDGVADGADAEGAVAWYADLDQDGFTSADSVTDCEAPVGYAAASAEPDCDDGDDAIFPGAEETVGDEVDGDCDGGELCWTDADDDGWRPYFEIDAGLVSEDADCQDAGEASGADPEGDCDDQEPLANPGLDEVADDGIDNDCDGEHVEDSGLVDSGTRAGHLVGGAGCGCDSGGAPAGVLGLLALAALRRRAAR